MILGGWHICDLTQPNTKMKSLSKVKEYIFLTQAFIFKLYYHLPVITGLYSYISFNSLLNQLILIFKRL